MYHTKVAGYDVIFPYEPYSIQKAYMGRLLDCLKNERNGLLESPTGTGKTLSILCAAMAWLDSQQEKRVFGDSESLPSRTKVKENESAADSAWGDSDLPSAPGFAFNSRLKVIYSSRTHVQLAQAMKELKRTYYKDRPAVILGSREQLCIHSEVKKLTNNSLKNQACRVKVSQHACSFYESYEQKSAKAFDDNQVIDIEDLVTKGTSGGFCPYYVSRLHKNRAEVIFTPYNYLLVPSLRRSQGIELDNSVIIFDEGHNIESICEESASTSIESTKLAMCISELNVFLEKAKNQIEDGSQMEEAAAYEAVKMVDEINTLGVDSIINLKNVLCDLEAEIDSQLIPMPKDKAKELDSGWIVQLVREKLSLKSDHIESLTKSIDKIGSILSINTTPSTGSKVTAFESMSDFFKTIAPLCSSDEEALFGSQGGARVDFVEEFKRKFRLALSTEEGREVYKKRMSKQWFVASKEEEPTTSWTLHIYCMSPSVAVNQLIECGAKSIIITSGTLAPMLSFEAEMEVPFPVKLENRHVIRDDQLKVRVIGKSWNDVVLDSTYNNRENMDYYKGLGDTVVDYSRIIPGGILVFFSSYTVMNKTIELWKNRFEWKIWENLTESKLPFTEPKDKFSFADAILKFKTAIEEARSDESKKGAIFFGVTRGKLSEGMDIGNDYCRGVMIVGLPFPSCFDKRSLLKRAYIESKQDPSFNFQTYYSLQMKRGLNQSIGRVIRHKDDFGVVLLCDKRFSVHKNSLSKWIQPFFSSNEDYSQTKKEIAAFFSNRSDCPSSQECQVDDVSKVVPANVPKFRNPLSTSTASAEVRKQNDMEVLSQYASSSNNPCPTSRKEKKEDSDLSKPGKFFDIFQRNKVERERDRLESSLKQDGLKHDSLKHDSLKQDGLKSYIGKRSLSSSVNPDGQVVDLASETEDSSSQNRGKKRLKVPFRSVQSGKNGEGEVAPQRQPMSDQELMKRFIEKEGIEIKRIFEGTKRFGNLCLELRKFNRERDVDTLIKALREIFIEVKKPDRDIFLAGMCVLIPRESRRKFIDGLKINLDYVPIEVFAGPRNMVTVVRGERED